MEKMHATVSELNAKVASLETEKSKTDLEKINATVLELNDKVATLQAEKQKLEEVNKGTEAKMAVTLSLTAPVVTSPKKDGAMVVSNVETKTAVVPMVPCISVLSLLLDFTVICGYIAHIMARLINRLWPGHTDVRHVILTIAHACIQETELSNEDKDVEKKEAEKYKLRYNKVSKKVTSYTCVDYHRAQTYLEYKIQFGELQKRMLAEQKKNEKVLLPLPYAVSPV